MAASEADLHRIVDSTAQYELVGNPSATSRPLSDSEVAYFNALLYERIRRDNESLRLYVPLDFQETFHASHAPERSLRAANRAGKTLSAAVEFARAVTGQDPHAKYPKTAGRAIIVCKNEKQCGEVVFKKLFRPGAFRIIRDLETRKWRPYLPDRDGHRKSETKKAPPLIPKRFYDPRSITWNKKNAEIPEKIVLKNGWEIYFFSSLGQAPQGWDVDIAWFDEEIVHPSWYNEIAARLIDRAEYDEVRNVWIGGKFFWSATPQAGTLKLFEIHSRAVDAESEEHPAVTEHTATMYDNPYLSEGAKAMFALKLENNSDEAAVRIYGEFALMGLRIYQEFQPRGVHGCKSFDIPANWTRYISIDPGRQVCAVLFAAVPPPSDPRHKKVFFYDELYIRRCNAEIFAQKLAQKIGRDVIYEALIDHHASRVIEMGSGKSVEEQYKAALVTQKVKFSKTGSASFTWGVDDPEARILAVKSGLQLFDGQAKFVVFTDKLPCLLKEAEEYRNATDKATGLPLDKPLKLNDHQMDNWGYLALHKMKYRSAKAGEERGGEAWQAMQRKKERSKQKDGWTSSVKVG